MAAPQQLMVSESISGGASCNTLRDDLNGSFDDWNVFSFYTYIATRFTAGATYTACKGIARFDVASTPPSGTVRCQIRTVNAGPPSGSILGTASDTLDRTTIPTGDQQVSLANLSASLTSSTQYFFVIQMSATDGGETIRWVRTNGSDPLYGSTDGTSWDFIGTGTLNFKLNST